MISLNLHKIVLTICPIIVFFQTLAIVGNNESINDEIGNEDTVDIIGNIYLLTPEIEIDSVVTSTFSPFAKLNDEIFLSFSSNVELYSVETYIRNTEGGEVPDDIQHDLSNPWE